MEPYPEKPALSNNGATSGIGATPWIDDPVRSRLSKDMRDFLDEISPGDATTGAVVEEKQSLPRIRKAMQTEFFRTFPGWQQSVFLYFAKEEAKSGTPYVVSKRMVNNEALPSVVNGIAVLSFMAKKNTMVIQLLRLPDPVDPHPAHTSMLSAIEDSRNQWVRVMWDKVRNEYRAWPGRSEETVDWAQWLGETPETQAVRATELFVQTVKQAGRYIDGPDHPVMLALLGIDA